MNIFRLIVALAFLVLGLVIGFLNDSPAITLDLIFFKWATTPGNAIILSLLTGVVIGGLIILATLVWPLYSKLRKANKQASASAPTSGTG
ncbi:MAG TPA: hypothetical protein VIT22_12605 [Pseudoxanthomonas sp.]